MEFLRMFLRSVTLLPGVVQDVEAMYGAGTGAKKRAAAIELVGSAIKIGDAVEGKQIVDADQFMAALGVIVDGVVACLNASVWAKKLNA
ncbi:hypothetical protein FTO74_00085 [Granulicella sp. WH15]|nr:hypothetical protein FTO74_00085 [Granulicella sp. WH15]